jgi:hypothetical protein
MERQLTNKQVQNDHKAILAMFNGAISGEVKHKQNGKREYLLEVEMKANEFEYYDVKKLARGFDLRKLSFDEMMAIWMEIPL